MDKKVVEGLRAAGALETADFVDAVRGFVDACDTAGIVLRDRQALIQTMRQWLTADIDVFKLQSYVKGIPLQTWQMKTMLDPTKH
mmetsp:Transcript_33609/g.82640  ORF Transcript_33609/g.82640 Transcript_33609/m.82640 type:complete len:85 (+) Transcript_33609:255-509(+)